MIQFKPFLMAAAGLALLTPTSHAQTTNLYPYYAAPPPTTKLEAIERGVGSIIIKASSPMGVVAANGGSVTITCKEDQDLGTGLKEYGAGVGFKVGDQAEETVLIDYDELDGLLDSIDRLNKLDWTVTSLSSFSAAYETKGGLRIAIFSSRRSGTIEIAVRITRSDSNPVRLTRDQLSQLRNLLDQTRDKLQKLIKGQ